jgi:hypothetical protein
MSAGSTVSDLFDLENQVGPYEGPRLGYAAEAAQEGGSTSDIVYSPGYTGPLVEREGAMDRYGGVLQLGGRRKIKKSRRRHRHFRKLKRLQRKSTHRRRR